MSLPVVIAATNIVFKMSLRWTFEGDFLRCRDGTVIDGISKVSSWDEDMRCWPQVSKIDIHNYFIETCDIDGRAMKNYKSLETYLARRLTSE